MKNIVNKLESIKIDGMGLIAYALSAIIFLLVLNFNLLPKNMMGALFAMIILGNVLYYLGSHLPIFKVI